MSNRGLIIDEQFRQVLSNTISLDMNDPELDGVTITRVRVSPDFQFADIRFTLLDDAQNPEKAIGALKRAKGVLKKTLARQIRMKRVPEMRFHLDEALLAERRINDILNSLHIPEPDNEES